MSVRPATAMEEEEYQEDNRVCEAMEYQEDNGLCDDDAPPEPSTRDQPIDDLLRRPRTQAEVVRLFQEKYPELPPISQGTVSKIEQQFRERGHVRELKKNPPNKLSNDQKLNILRVLTENQMHPYKLVPTNELAEDDFDRRILFL
ncbi:hypothetical protein NQ318_003821 [Aromia moschata]|uniref:DUF4817 domain-containing protein n=1 Tax=Aromia moschata TaxID=1265417 RepID=A0AAV8XUZ8_9CUCU|nr:hypothetical protein NQ318_003821 [Aromia moschata]